MWLFVSLVGLSKWPASAFRRLRPSSGFPLSLHHGGVSEASKRRPRSHSLSLPKFLGEILWLKGRPPILPQEGVVGARQSLGVTIPNARARSIQGAPWLWGQGLVVAHVGCCHAWDPPGVSEVCEEARAG